MKRTRLLAKQYDAREAYWQRVLRMHREWRELYGLEQEAAIRVKHLGARR